jgi:signal transduction histidine kinase/CheY-like chemotaxis protein
LPQPDESVVSRALVDRLKSCVDHAVPPEIAEAGPLAMHPARVMTVASPLALGTGMATLMWSGLPLPLEAPATGIALTLFASPVPLMWWTRRVDPASSALPAGLAAYVTISTYGSGGALPFAALMIPIATLLAGMICRQRTALAWLAAFWLLVPAALIASPAEAPASSHGAALLGTALILAVPASLTMTLYRALYDQLLAERMADALATQLASERQALLDARLREAERLASLGRMAGGIAHSFNNILTAIRGSAELLGVSPRSNAADREHTERIAGSVDRAASLVKQLLDFTGRGRRRVETLALKSRTAECARILGAALAKEATLELREIADAQLEADPAQLDQVVEQLVRNAVRAYDGKAGVVVLETDRVKGVQPPVIVPPDGLARGDYAVLRVRDQGRGIEPADLRRVFEPFFATFGGGRGLGLAAVLGIVRGHGGGIAVASQLGVGTEMTVYLPCQPEYESGAAAVQPPRAPSSGALRGRRVLVVDDEADVRAVLVRHLAASGADPHPAVDGIDALHRLAALGPVDGAFVDVSMPRMNGVDLLAALRASGRCFPVVLMTGHAEVDVAHFVEEANVAVLLKPFHLAEVGSALERAERASAHAQA